MNILIRGEKIKITPFVPCLASIVILLFLRDFIGVGIPSFLFLGLTILVALFAERTEVIAFCFCCIPILNAFQSKYALLICMVVYFVRFLKLKVIPWQLVLITFLFTWEIMHGILGAFSAIETVRLFSELLFCCFVMCLPTDSINFNKIVRSMSAMTIGACFVLLLSQLKEHNYQVNMLFSGIFRLGSGVDETVMSVGFNPNYLSYICLCCVEGLAFLAYKKQHTVLDLISMMALVVFGFLTLSKKYIICAVIFLFLFMLSRRNKAKTILASAIIILAVVVVIQNIFPTAYEAFLLRFEQEDLSTGRNSIFSFYNQQLLNDMGLLFFGVGWHGYVDKLLAKYHFSIPHNGFQELLVMWGIPGFLAFVTFLILLLSYARKTNRQIKLINYIPFIIMLANVQVSQMISSSVVIMLISFVYICLITHMNEGENENILIQV